MHDERTKVPEQRSLAATLLRPKVALPLTLLVLALLSPLIIRGWNLSRIADLDEPALPPRAPAVATPEDESALHHFRLAVEQVDWSNDRRIILGDSIELGDSIDDFFFPRPPFPVVLICGNSMSMLNSEKLLEEALNPDPESHASHKSLVDFASDQLEVNKGSLAEWRTATRLLSAPARDEVSFFEADENQRHLYFLFTRSLLYADLLQSTEGRLEEAWESWLSAYRFYLARTRCSPGRGPNIDYIFSKLIFTFKEITRSPEVTPELSRRMLADLDSAQSLAADLDWLVQRSYERTRQRVLDYYASVSAQREAAEAGSVVDAGSTVAGESRMKLYIRGEPEISLRVLKHHYTWLRLWFSGEGRYSADHETFPYRLGAGTHSGSLPRDLMTPVQIEEACRTRAVCLREAGLESPSWASECNRRRWQCEWFRGFVAAQWFARDNGSPPHSIDDLVPDYLPEIPVNPFEPDARPLRMTREEYVMGIRPEASHSWFFDKSRADQYFEDLFKPSEAP